MDKPNKTDTHDQEIDFQGEEISDAPKRGRGRPKGAETHPEAEQIRRSYSAMKREVRAAMKDAGGQVRANLLRQLQLLEQEERNERVKRGISPEKLNVEAIKGYKWICKIGQREPRLQDAFSCALRCLLELTYGMGDNFGGFSSNNVLTLLDQFCNSVDEIDLVKVNEELRPFAKDIWLRALTSVAEAHKRASSELGLGQKFSSIDDIRAAHPTKEQMSEARDRFIKEAEGDAHDEKFGIPKAGAANTKERTAPKRNPLMK